jgi:glucans biosynthesis protein
MAESDALVCGARLRQGGRCALPPVAGRRRCFQHGGARGIGAPKGSRNAWKHGVYSREQIALRRQINAFFRDCLRTMREIEESLKDPEG